VVEPALFIPDNDKNERKNPFRKEGNVWQSRRVRSKFNQLRHNNIKMPILVLVVFCGQLH